MKHIKHFGYIFLLPFVFNSCSKKEVQNKSNIPSKNFPVQDISSLREESISSTSVDVDLTKMSDTMIYSYVFDMVVNSQDYINKNIKIKGNFTVFQDPESGENYFAILIPDATACCQQGIEFIWQGTHQYPSDYPQLNQEITITGKYKMTEDEQGISHSFLIINDLTF